MTSILCCYGKWFVLVMLLITIIYPCITSSSVFEIDSVTTLVRVIDGDTIVVRIDWLSDKFIGEIEIGGEYRVRFADINAPEIDTFEGKISSRELSKLIKPGDTVFLDIDDDYVFDKYGRIVAVVFIKYNETHLLNVNEWLLYHGYAEIWDHDNEFNPWEWPLYIDINNINKASSSYSVNSSRETINSFRDHLSSWGLYYLLIVIGIGVSTFTLVTIYYLRIRRD